MNDSENAKIKAKVRASKAWKDFREVVRKNQNNKDFLTEKKLSKKTAAVHHMDLNIENYGDFSDITHFYFLNSKSHEAVHWAYEEAKNDPKFLERFCFIINEMIRINDGKTFNQF